MLALNAKIPLHNRDVPHHPVQSHVALAGSGLRLHRQVSESFREECVPLEQSLPHVYQQIQIQMNRRIGNNQLSQVPLDLLRLNQPGVVVELFGQWFPRVFLEGGWISSGALKLPPSRYQTTQFGQGGT